MDNKERSSSTSRELYLKYKDCCGSNWGVKYSMHIFVLGCGQANVLCILKLSSLVLTDSWCLTCCAVAKFRLLFDTDLLECVRSPASAPETWTCSGFLAPLLSNWTPRASRPKPLSFSGFGKQTFNTVLYILGMNKNLTSLREKNQTDSLIMKTNPQVQSWT